jgi:hypothetical protein
MRVPSKIAILAPIALSWALGAPASAKRDSTGPIVKSADTPACDVENLIAGKKPSASQEIHGNVALITDGAVAAEGAQWDAPVVVTLETGTGFVTYDLGQPRSISALLLQADANDTYQVQGSQSPQSSTDPTPASFKPIVEIQNVVDRGPGLRTRAVEFPPVTVRYLRVGQANGDGFYSISELAAYCKKPAPFPPAFRIVEAPLAQVGGAPPAPAGPRSKHDGGSILILVAAAAALAWLAYRTVTR